MAVPARHWKISRHRLHNTRSCQITVTMLVCRNASNQYNGFGNDTRLCGLLLAEIHLHNMRKHLCLLRTIVHCIQRIRGFTFMRYADRHRRWHWHWLCVVKCYSSCCESSFSARRNIAARALAALVTASAVRCRCDNSLSAVSLSADCFSTTTLSQLRFCSN